MSFRRFPKSFRWISRNFEYEITKYNHPCLAYDIYISQFYVLINSSNFWHGTDKKLKGFTKEK